MALAISDLSYDLTALVRTYDRANDFARADEYRALLARVEEQDQEYSDLFDKYDNLEDQHRERVYELQVAERQRDINARLLSEIADMARSALNDYQPRDEDSLLDALANILSYAEA